MAEVELPKHLPYRAEYAKSGRAKCKGCANEIGKGELRMAIMTKSPFFDGLQPNWHHYTCFFQKAHPKSVGDISHYESLRWDDQEKIKTKLATASAAASSPSALKTTFMIEYAKSNRSTCPPCDVKIDKGEIRIGKKDFESESAQRFGPLFRWHHVDCFVKVRNELDFLLSGKILPGFRDLEKGDQELIKTKLPEIKPSSKRKLPDETNGDSKKIKTEASEDKRDEAVKKQNKAMYKIRDQIVAAHTDKQITTKELQKLLEYNKQDVPSGAEKMYDRLADVMTFGALERCKVCKDGQLVYRSGVGYQCLGDLTEFTKCSHVTEDPKRKPFKVPKEFLEVEEFHFLLNYKMKAAQKRIIPKHAAPVAAASASTSKAGYQGPKITLKPLDKFRFFIDLSLDAKAMQKKIESFGGKVMASITSKSKVTAIISTQEQVDAGKEKYIRNAKDNKTPIVSTKFVDSIRDVDYNLTEQIQLHLLVDWIKPLEIRAHLRAVNPDFEKSKKEESEKSKYEVEMKKIKLKMKDGAVVDPESGLEDSGHVYKEGGKLYSVILSKVDVEEGSNKYYKLQLIQSDKRKEYYVFRSWGRLGTTIGGNQCDEQGSKEAALTLFCKLYKDKTGNEFGKPFSKRAGHYMPMDIHYSDSKEAVKKLEPSTKTSKLDMAVQALIALIFDVDNMQRTLLEFELDLEKMPLGKISKAQILNAYSLLSETTKLLDEGPKKTGYQRLLVDVTNRFFTLIPHNFGTSNPPLLQNIEFVKQKIDMLENLMEVELAYELLKEGDEKGGSPIDAHYKTLKCSLGTLDKGSQMWQILEKYMKNTHAETHNQYELELENIYTVDRKGEEKRYSKFSSLHNRQLLWHGSRISNYPGILSQGLRIAPPEAPPTGYMFGKGVYFADMVSKSANYCNASRGSSKGLLLLSEVALGDMAEFKDAKDTLLKAPRGKHSVKGLGSTCPDPNEVFTLPTGTVVPFGKPTKSNVRDSSLLYNEYIVYDVAQVNILYLLEVNFKYKSRR